MMCECNLILTKVQNEYDVEQLRLIRNECKNFMTRNTSEILKEQQQQWYKNLNKEINELYLFNSVLFGVAVSSIGYGYIRIENDSVLLTGGITSSERGKGYGYILFDYLVKNAKKFNLPIKLEVLKTNTVALSVYNKLGFKATYDDEKLIKMEYNYDSVI